MIKLRLILYHASPLRHRWRDATSPKVRGLGNPRKRHLFAKGSPPLGKTPSGRREMSRKRQKEDACRAKRD